MGMVLLPPSPKRLARELPRATRSPLGGQTPNGPAKPVVGPGGREGGGGHGGTPADDGVFLAPLRYDHNSRRSPGRSPRPHMGPRIASGRSTLI